MQVKTKLLEPVLLEIVPGFHVRNVEGVAQALEMGPQQKVRRTKQGQDSCAKLKQNFLKCILIQSTLNKVTVRGEHGQKVDRLFKPTSRPYYSSQDHIT